MTRAEFVEQLKNFHPIEGLDDAALDAYIDTALGALSLHQPRIYRLVGIPAQSDNGGLYKDVIPADAVDVEAVYQHNSDVQIEFDVFEVDGAGRQLQLKGVKLPSWVGITTYAGQIQDYNNYHDNDYADRPANFFGGLSYDKFDMVYTTEQTIEGLDKTLLVAVQKYIESESYRARASAESSRSEIVDRDITGASTTYRSGRNAGMSYAQLAKDCMAEFNSLVQRPFLSVGRYGEIQKLWVPGEIS